MFLLSTDIDGTIYDGTETAQRFAEFWQCLKKSELPPVLCYNTGRALGDTQSLIARTSLPEPDYIIAGVGTEMFDCGQNRAISAWADEISASWDFESVKRAIVGSGVEIELQPEECQNLFKCSWFFHGKPASAINALASAISAAGIDAQLIYSSNRDLDILPCRANKGNAISWLAERLGFPTSRILVAGDSANDSSMFSLANVSGIVVSNAEPALLSTVSQAHHRTLEPCADGVIEGITHWLQAEDPGFLTTLA